jgi:uncharacterized DUF497 family protein
MKIHSFEWDTANAGHIAERHGLSEDDVEEIFYNCPAIRKMRGGRLVAYGQIDSGRYLTVIFHLKPDGVVRVVTARDSNQWERRYYQQVRRD